MTADEIKAKRLELNMTQAELAAAFGADANTIARWERGEREPAMPGMLRLAFRTLTLERAGSPQFEELIAHNLNALKRSRVRHRKLQGKSALRSK